MAPEFPLHLQIYRWAYPWWTCRISNPTVSKFFSTRLNAFGLCFAVIDAEEVETRAEEILGLVSDNEYELLLTKLGGTRQNRVFHFIGIKAPQQSAETLLATQKAAGRTSGVGITSSLEKRKARRGGGAGASAPKCQKLLDLLTSLPLRSKGESEEDGSKTSPLPPPLPNLLRWRPHR